MTSNLGNLEELVLLLVMVMEEDAYGVSLAEEYQRIKGKSISIPAIHTVLKRLEKKSFMSSEVGGASKIRGGRRKRIYRITDDGFQAAKSIQESRNALWKLAPKIAAS